MTNAERFRNIFGIYATELWVMSEPEFLEWLNTEAEAFSVEPRWILITERKPDDGYRVIVTDFGYVEVARWFDGRWYDIDGNTLKGVTAWMPLPEPWKGADDE